MKSILEIDSVTKSFGDNKIITDVYLRCESNDIIGILGKNGSGKSTLFKILFGTLSADNKFIKIDGKIYDQPYKSKNILTYLPQKTFLPSHLRLNSLIELCFGKYAVDVFLNDDVLYKLKQSKVYNLSGGELRYLEVKIVLFIKSKFAILDEPFSNMSPILIDELKKIIIEKSKIKGIILADHDYENVFSVANKYYFMSNGSVELIKDKFDFVNKGYISHSKFIL
ncbi:ATP-binding cassette domain-containing protein [Alistipes sp. ZOR0009]|uniref:ATP-binding cassette domain-containing protein n=1 Tax=Alistipes sp. ZOR0009 TaxID=1339253 RepID=UPI0006486F46|nr:ATP-binding cassette domain-containing protein [Alistipes sp. ZOR0009]